MIKKGEKWPLHHMGKGIIAFSQLIKARFL